MILLPNVPHDRTEKRTRTTQMQSSMMKAKKLKMASFSRSAVYAIVGTVQGDVVKLFKYFIITFCLSIIQGI